MAFQNYWTDRNTLLFVIIISAFALGSALIAQYAFNILPCNLCLYQRVPFAAAIIIAITGLATKSHKPLFIVLCGIAFTINAIIAFYHFGVEQHWWISAFEGCKVSFENTTNPDDMLNKIMTTPSVPCDKPAWIDPIFGMSMAFYNILLCALMALVCSVSVIKKPNSRAS